MRREEPYVKPGDLIEVVKTQTYGHPSLSRDEYFEIDEGELGLVIRSKQIKYETFHYAIFRSGIGWIGDYFVEPVRDDGGG